MIRHLMIVAWRRLVRHPADTAINVIGLAIGMAACLLAVLYVADELGYDRYNERADRIVRLVLDVKVPDGNYATARTSPPMAAALREDFPEVVATFRIRPAGSVLVAAGERRFYEDRFYFSDPAIFDVLTLPLSVGNADTALRDPFTVVLTAEAARRYFGEANPLGRTFFLDRQHSFTVTGILAPVPSRSHFKPEFLASFVGAEAIFGSRLENWGWTGVNTYLLLRSSEAAPSLAAKFPAFLERRLREDWAATWRLSLQPLGDIHLRSHRAGELEANGLLRTSVLLVTVALFILLIAGFNAVNMTLARAERYARDFGLRKVLGAEQSQLVGLILTEAGLQSLGAGAVAFTLARAILPAFNALARKTLSIDVGAAWIWAPSALLLCGLVALAAGFYPALLLSRIRPAWPFHGRGKAFPSRFAVRRGFVVVQFAISIALLISAFTVARQLRYVLNADLGFDKDQVVTIPMQDPDTQASWEAIKAEIGNSPGVVSVSVASDVPGRGYDQIVHTPEGTQTDDAPSIPIYFADADFVKTLGIEIVSGRNFLNVPGGETDAFLVNEAAVRRFGWSEPLGRRIDDGEGRQLGRVVGVVRDFHFESLHSPIQPVLVRMLPDWFETIVVRLRPGNVRQTLAFLEETWARFEPAFPFSYAFLDDIIGRQYRPEQWLARTFSVTSAVAVLVACLGLFGLAAANAAGRTKEIGIRKVLGASVSWIALRLSAQFGRWVLAANLLAWPAGWWLMTRWLRNFAYRESVSLSVLALSGGLALAIALVTVGWQAVRAALANPVDSLRNE